jgi:hypothetical protein
MSLLKKHVPVTVVVDADSDLASALETIKATPGSSPPQRHEGMLLLEERALSRM